MIRDVRLHLAVLAAGIYLFAAPVLRAAALALEDLGIALCLLLP